MKKSIGAKAAIFPMPVLMIAAYDKEGTPNVMNAAWGIMCGSDKVALFINKDHKTTKNIMETKEFTVAIADKDSVELADFFGIASGNNIYDKVAKSGCKVSKATKVNAPIIEEFPVVMECELVEDIENDQFHCVVGKIVETLVEDKMLDNDGEIDPSKINALIFDQFKSGYYVTGEKVGQAWADGMDMYKKVK